MTVGPNEAVAPTALTPGAGLLFSFRNHTFRSHFGTLAMLGILASRKRSADALDEARADLGHVLARLRKADQG